MRIILVVFGLMALASSGCKGEGGGDGGAASAGGEEAAEKVERPADWKLFSCDKHDRPGNQSCQEFTGAKFDKKAVARRCSGEEHVIEGKCPTEGVVASCKVAPGKAGEYVVHNYSDGQSKEWYAKRCKETLRGEVL